MKRKILTRASLASAFLLLGLMLTACNNDEPDYPEGPVGRTIMMYLPDTGSNSLYSDFQQNINDICEAMRDMGGLGDCRFVVFMSESVEKAWIFELRYNRKTNTVVKDTIDSVRKPELTTAAGLETVIGRLKAIAPAYNYAMIVGSHGDGWLPAKPTSQNRARWYGSSDVNYRADMNTLAEAIDACDIHLDYMLFDMCYMSCIETAYDLRHVTDYVIGSTSEVADYGVPFKSVLRHLVAEKPQMENLVNDYIGFYSTYKYPYATLGVTRCEFVEDMAALMREINTRYAITPEQLAKVQDLDVEHYTPDVYVDFGDYVDKMLATEGTVTAPDSEALLQRFHDLMADLVPYKGTTGSIMSQKPWEVPMVIPLKAFSGLSISDASENPVAVTAKKNTAWWKATHNE